MHVYGELTGILTPSATITGALSNPGTLEGFLTIPSAVGAPIYDGDYEVTPRLYAQSLDTDGKLMEDDVTVYEIPITHTTNPTGGLTVLIG